jgi:hypothetical protein
MKEWDKVPGLVNIAVQIKKQSDFSSGRIHVDTDAGIVLFQGMEIHNTITDYIIRMANDGFDVQPVVKFLDNVLANPNPMVATRLFDWMSAGQMPITDDGCFVAYKRVRNDYKSFHDGKTDHKIGQVTSMPREMCDSNQNNCCSTGLHFCSQGYLPSYNGGEGRVLVLKINPIDVVAIPDEYGTHKGRCCKYEVMSELTNEYRKTVEITNPLTQPVVDANTNFGVTKSFILGYTKGYAAGKAKSNHTKGGFHLNGEFNKGYEEGYKDGRGHKGKRYKG